MIRFSDSPKKSMPQDGIVLTRTLALIAVAVVAVAVGAYVLVHSDNNSKKDTTTKPTSSSAAISTPGAAATNTDSGIQLEIKEFGMSIKLPAELKSLSYKVETNPQKTFTIVNLTTDDYTALANKCTGAAKDTPQTLASLVKTTGQYDSNQVPKTQNLKQFADFYIANLGGSQPQGVVCKDQSAQQQYNDLYTKLNDALGSSFSSARLTK